MVKCRRPAGGPARAPRETPDDTPYPLTSRQLLERWVCCRCATGRGGYRRVREVAMARLLTAVVSVVVLVGCGGGQGVVTLVIDPPSTAVQQGQTARFTVVVTGTTNKAVTWTATGGQLIAKGTGATFVALEAGSFEVTATSQANPMVMATATILVTAVPGKAHIRFVSDGSAVLAGAGATQRLAGEVISEDGAVVET